MNLTGLFSAAELGQAALILALAASLLGLLPLRYADRPIWQAVGRRCAHVIFAGVAVAFLSLVYAFVTSDFSVWLVAAHSQTLQPLAYKIAGAWGQHEGSLLLWLLILAGCGAAMARQRSLPPVLKARALGIMAALAAGFAALSLLTSNPFARLTDPPLEGRDLNPLLQDPGLVLHPPLLYLGYVGFSAAFALALAVLLDRDGESARRLGLIRPWALFAWTALTAGLTLGSWWSYYELGWGGWWFWDPVENVALLPWLTGTALLHSLRTVQSRATLLRWTLWLALASFALSLLGTFLVRSGVLTSVHTFAADPVRGLAILALFTCAVGGAFALYARRLPHLPAETAFLPLSREGLLLLNNILLCCAAGVVLLGTLYPLIVSALGLPPLSVGAPYFNSAALPLLLPLAFVMPLGMFVSWRRGTLARLRRVLLPLGLTCLLLTIAYLYAIGYRGALALLGMAGGLWAVAGSALDMRRHWRALDRARHWPRWLAHLGLGVAILGMAGAPLDFDSTRAIAPGQSFSFANYEFTAEALPPQAGPNYTDSGIALDVTHDGAAVTRLMPTQRTYPAADATTTEAAIYSTPLGDLFATASPAERAGETVLRLRYHPLQVWIWGGALLMVLGGLAGLVRRRA